NLAVGWVTGGVEYGRGELLRTWLESRRVSYVLAVAGGQTLVPQFGPAGPRSLGVGGAPPRGHPEPDPAGRPGGGRRGLRPGRKVSPSSEWARIDVTPRGNDSTRADHGPAVGFARTLLIQRRPGSAQSTFYLAHAPKFSSLDALVAVAQAQQSARACLRATH